jgi:hypothetical protein
MPAVVISNAGDGAKVFNAPSGYQFTRVIGGELSPVADSVLSLKSGSDVIWTAAVKAGTPISVNVDPNRTIDCAPGKQLNIGSSSGNVNGTLELVVKGLPDPSLLAGQ